MRFEFWYLAAKNPDPSCYFVTAYWNPCVKYSVPTSVFLATSEYVGRSWIDLANLLWFDTIFGTWNVISLMSMGVIRKSVCNFIFWTKVGKIILGTYEDRITCSQVKLFVAVSALCLKKGIKGPTAILPFIVSAKLFTSWPPHICYFVMFLKFETCMRITTRGLFILAGCIFWGFIQPYAEPGDSHSISTKNCSAQNSQLLSPDDGSSALPGYPCDLGRFWGPK